MCVSAVTIFSYILYICKSTNTYNKKRIIVSYHEHFTINNWHNDDVDDDNAS